MLDTNQTVNGVKIKKKKGVAKSLEFKIGNNGTVVIGDLSQHKKSKSGKKSYSPNCCILIDEDRYLRRISVYLDYESFKIIPQLQRIEKRDKRGRLLQQEIEAVKSDYELPYWLEYDKINSVIEKYIN